MSQSRLTSRRPRAVLPQRRRDLRRPAVVARVLLLALLATLGTLLWAPAASAHDELLDLEPGNNVTVTTPPTQVQLVFGAVVLKVGTQIRVTGPKGAVVSTGPVSIDQGTVVQKLIDSLPDGLYRVDWRVTSADGHPVSGTYTFTLKAASTASASPGASASASAPPASTPPAPAATAAGSTGDKDGSTSSGSGSPSTGLVVGAAAVVAVLAGTAFAIVRRRNGASVSHEGNPKK